MGNAQSARRVAAKAKARSDAIDVQLELERRRALLTPDVTILVVGAAGSDVTSMVKRMHIAHAGGLSPAERIAYRDVILSNVVEHMRTILSSMHMYDIITEPQNVSAYAMVLALPPSFTTPLPPRITDALLALWADVGVQDAVFRLQDVVLDSHALYLLDALARVLDTGYVPTEQDILRARKPAAGLEETVLRVGELTYRLLDTAGLCSERRKWLHLLEDVTVVLFVVSLAQYDEMLYEDESINKMHEALTLFDSFCNSRWFVNTSIILFLDDSDLFAEKLSRSPLGDYFPDYTGGDSYDAACDYFLHRFVSLNQSAATKQIHAHYTCASDAQKFKFVLSAILNILLQIHLRKCGLL